MNDEFACRFMQSEIGVGLLIYHDTLKNPIS